LTKITLESGEKFPGLAANSIESFELVNLIKCTMWIVEYKYLSWKRHISSLTQTLYGWICSEKRGGNDQ